MKSESPHGNARITRLRRGASCRSRYRDLWAVLLAMTVGLWSAATRADSGSINVRDFWRDGCDKDATPAFQAAMRRAQEIETAPQRRGAIWIPNGMYRIHALEMESNLIWRCESRSAIFEGIEPTSDLLVSSRGTFNVELH
ncbi:MAG TPA: hypothetical protein VIY86_11270, partial [Pirellulaceae bacterium]